MTHWQACEQHGMEPTSCTACQRDKARARVAELTKERDAAIDLWWRAHTAMSKVIFDFATEAPHVTSGPWPPMPSVSTPEGTWRCGCVCTVCVDRPVEHTPCSYQCSLERRDAVPRPSEACPDAGYVAAHRWTKDGICLGCNASVSPRPNEALRYMPDGPEKERVANARAEQVKRSQSKILGQYGETFAKLAENPEVDPSSKLPVLDKQGGCTDNPQIVSDWVPMPPGWSRMSVTGVQCDMVVGACACGATHSWEELSRVEREYVELRRQRSETARPEYHLLLEAGRKAAREVAIEECAKVVAHYFGIEGNYVTEPVWAAVGKKCVERVRALVTGSTEP